MLVETNSDHFTITFNDGKKSKYHFLWLRHNCDCLKTSTNLDGCKHEVTKERILNLSTLSFDIKPKTFKIIEDKFEIIWEDKHETIFEEKWLKEHEYSPEYYLPNIKDIQIEHKDRNPKKLYQILSTFGVVVVRNGSNEIEETFKIAEEFGSEIIDTHFGKVEDLMPNNTTNKNNDQLGYTFEKVDLHTDQPFIKNPPTMQLLHCIKRSKEGGANKICDVRLATQELKRRNEKYFKLLTTIPVHFKRRQKNFQSDFISPILTVDSLDVRIFFFPLQIKKNRI